MGSGGLLLDCSLGFGFAGSIVGGFPVMFRLLVDFIGISFGFLFIG